MEIILFIIDNITSLINIFLALIIMLMLRNSKEMDYRIETLENAVKYLLKKEDDEMDI